MVLVRKSELACRTDWADDLWEAKQDVEPVPITSSPRFIPESRDGNAGRQYTDRVTAVSVSMAPHPPADAASTSGAFAPVRSEVDSPREVNPQRPPATRDQIDAQRTMASSPEPVQPNPGVRALPDQRRDGSSTQSPSFEKQSQPVAPPQIRSSPSRQDQDFELPRRAGREDVTAERQGAAQSFVPPGSSQSSISSRDQRSSSPADVIRRPVQPAPRESRRDERVPSPRTSNQPAAPQPPPMPTFGAIPETRTSDDPLSRGRSGWTEPFAVTRPAQDGQDLSARVEAKPEGQAPVAEPAVGSPSPATTNQVAIRECCGTCRDFRPAEGGERGWCNNQYAFDHRRMVDRNDIACRGTIGSWWIASDDWWLQRADIAHHGRPTPIVDDLLRKLLDSRASGFGRRSGRV